MQTASVTYRVSVLVSSPERRAINSTLGASYWGDSCRLRPIDRRLEKIFGIISKNKIGNKKLPEGLDCFEK